MYPSTRKYQSPTKACSVNLEIWRCSQSDLRWADNNNYFYHSRIDGIWEENFCRSQNNKSLAWLSRINICIIPTLRTTRRKVAESFGRPNLQKKRRSYLVQHNTPFNYIISWWIHLVIRSKTSSSSPRRLYTFTYSRRDTQSVSSRLTSVHPCGRSRCLSNLKRYFIFLPFNDRLKFYFAKWHCPMISRNGEPLIRVSFSVGYLENSLLSSLQIISWHRYLCCGCEKFLFCYFVSCVDGRFVGRRSYFPRYVGAKVIECKCWVWLCLRVVARP